MEVKFVSVDNILCDIRTRINEDISQLKENVEQHGITEPLVVEGPTINGQFYLIDGFRRLAALKSIKRVAKVKIQVIRPETTINERRLERLRRIYAQKKMAGVDTQLLMQDILHEGNLTIEELAKILGQDAEKLKRARPETNVPEEMRRETAHKRASQLALEVIYNLHIDPLFKQQLYSLLLNREITSEHATALRRLTNNSLYKMLNDLQRKQSIMEVLTNAKFTSEDAVNIILLMLMKDNPIQHEEYLDYWVGHICNEIEKLAEYTHTDIEYMVNRIQLQNLRSALGKLNRMYMWVWKNWEDVI